MRKRYYAGIVCFAGSLIITYVAGYVIGVLGHGVEIKRIDGYGYYSMNLNAVYNPTSLGNYNWSAIFKTHPQTLGNYDGFNYLGVGIFVLIAFLVICYVFLMQEERLLKIIKMDVPLVIICVCLSLYAISNVVTFNDKVIMTIPLPPFLQHFCDIFRASSRMFYPVYYLIIIIAICSLWKLKKYLSTMKVYGVLTLVILIQLFDIKSCIFQKHVNMITTSNEQSILDDKVLKAIGDNSKGLLLDEWVVDIRKTALWALKNDMDVYPALANSGVYEKSSAITETNLKKIKSTGDIGDFVVVTSKPELLEIYNSFPKIASYKYDNIYYIFKSGTGGYYDKTAP